MPRATSDWLGIPEGISRRIRFLQMQARLQTALDARPKAESWLENSEVYTRFTIGDVSDPRFNRLLEAFGSDAFQSRVLTYDWKEDTYEWFEDDNAWGYSIFRDAEGAVYGLDRRSGRRDSPMTMQDFDWAHRKST